MMNRVATVARVTVIETLRDRVMIAILIFAAGLILGGLALYQFSIGAWERVVANAGLTVMHSASILMAVFLGVRMVQQEVTERTGETMLCRPLGRGEFLVGKFLGITATLYICVGIMAALEYGVIERLRDARTPMMPHYKWAVLGVALELAVMTAFAVLFSTFARPVSSALLTLGVFILGHAAPAYLTMAGSEGQVPAVARGLYWLAPDLERFNFKVFIDHAAYYPLTAGHIGEAAAAAAAYVVLTLALAVAIFRRKDLVD